jgi:long-chain acyl-CoA synthetase
MSIASPLQHHAAARPEGIAYRMLESGDTVTWSELELRSRRCAALLIACGLQAGDGIVVAMENHLRYFEILWAAQRAGLYYTTVSRHLKAEETRYIATDCGAKALFTSAVMLEAEPGLDGATAGLTRYLLDGAAPGFLDYEAALASVTADVQLPERPEGTDFCYSSGTTGRPKGIKRPLASANSHFAYGDSTRFHWKTFDENTVYLSTAPFYHTAPVRWNLNVMRAGGSCVLMQKFDEQRALEAIEKFRVTHSQWVPTMFIRMLRLPDDVRRRYELGSLKVAVHAAAPCPVWVKQAMIDWWGPVLYEYYSGTELVGRTSLDSHEWLAHRGSVGRPEFGQVHICNEEGLELAVGQTGVVYFSGGPSFEYHNDPEKTLACYDSRGWATFGDIGHVDGEGYLYLTDRLANTIVSGGVNLYPQETEDVLGTHPAVADVAVIGVPNAEFGEEVKAVVQLRESYFPTPALALALIAHCRTRLSPLKCPRSVDFSAEMPRTDTGKLLKREIKERYWAGSASRIAH